MTVSSFDIFDTCITRACGDAHSFFAILSKLVFSEAVSSRDYDDFVFFRELSGRKNSLPSSTLKDIYDSLEYSHPKLFSKEKLMQIEMDLEYSLWQPVEKVRRTIEQKKRRGDIVLFISDMYLPSFVISKWLNNSGLSGNVFVSCEHGARKSDGSLFKYIHGKMGLKYCRWHHYGDNWHSDFIQPSKLGIHCHHIHHEYVGSISDFDNRTTCYYSLFALERSVGLSCSYFNLKNLFLDIVAPLYCTFTYRVLCDAVKSGISRLFFCSRDCYSLYRMAKVFLPLFHGLNVQYLWVSRNSLASDGAEILGYFDKEGLASNDYKCAIVDITSSGESFIKINEILEANGYQKVKGYFWELFGRDSEFYRKAVYDYSCEIDDSFRMERDYVATLANNHILYELVFPLNDQISVARYENAMPVFDGETSSEYCINNRDVIIGLKDLLLDKYAALFLQMRLYERADDIMSNFVIPRLYSFLKRPSKRYLKELSAFNVIRNGKTVPLVKHSILWPFLIARNSVGWIRGTIAYNSSVNPDILKKILD